jgi:hypothetical protein
MGETHLHVLEIISQLHDTHFGMSVNDIIEHVAAKCGFTNLHQLALKTVLGVQIKRDAFLEFKNKPVVHLFTLKGKSDEKSDLQTVCVFRYRDGGPCMMIPLQTDMIDGFQLLINACVYFDLEIEKFELETMNNDNPFDFYLQRIKK